MQKFEERWRSLDRALCNFFIQYALAKNAKFISAKYLTEMSDTFHQYTSCPGGSGAPKPQKRANCQNRPVSKNKEHSNTLMQ